ncbi:unnamed protein product [Brassica oleracea]
MIHLSLAATPPIFPNSKHLSRPSFDTPWNQIFFFKL